MPYKCDTCHDTKLVTSEGDSRDVIESKDGTREAWVGLLERTRFHDCPDCVGRGKPRKVAPGVENRGPAVNRGSFDIPETQPPVVEPERKKRKYTKRSKRWFKEDKEG